MSVLLNVTIYSEGATQSYALTALREALTYGSGLEDFLANEALVARLFALVDTSTLSNLCKQALELLLFATAFHGWATVCTAAARKSEKDDAAPFEDVAELLTESGDYDVRLNAVALLNALIDNAPNEASKRAMLEQFETNLEVAATLRRLCKVKATPDAFRNQTQAYERSRLQYLGKVSCVARECRNHLGALVCVCVRARIRSCFWTCMVAYSMFCRRVIVATHSQPMAVLETRQEGCKGSSSAQKGSRQVQGEEEERHGNRRRERPARWPQQAAQAHRAESTPRTRDLSTNGDDGTLARRTSRRRRVCGARGEARGVDGE